MLSPIVTTKSMCRIINKKKKNPKPSVYHFYAPKILSFNHLVQPMYYVPSISAAEEHWFVVQKLMILISLPELLSWVSAQLAWRGCWLGWVTQILEADSWICWGKSQQCAQGLSEHACSMPWILHLLHLGPYLNKNVEALLLQMENEWNGQLDQNWINCSNTSFQVKLDWNHLACDLELKDIFRHQN